MQMKLFETDAEIKIGQENEDDILSDERLIVGGCSLGNSQSTTRRSYLN